MNSEQKYYVGQEGEFEILDGFGNPREKLAGRIVHRTAPDGWGADGLGPLAIKARPPHRAVKIGG